MYNIQVVKLNYSAYNKIYKKIRDIIYENIPI